jgi:bacteriocin-like protein
MKKVKFNGKLSLNKETIANLNNNELNNVKGGAEDTKGPNCVINTKASCGSCGVCPTTDLWSDCYSNRKPCNQC